MLVINNMDEFTSEELQQIEENYTINTYKEYLFSTDWYYARKMETGKEVPAEIVANRIAARNYLNGIKQGD